MTKWRSPLFVVFLNLSACSMLPIEPAIEPGYFRIENFSDNHINDTKEYVFTMCHKHKPTSWITARQYPAGEQSIWVKATYRKVGLMESYREAYVNFQMNFSSGENYQLVHTIENDQISIWLRDPISFQAKSDIQTTPLQRHNIGDNGLRIQQCKSGSI